MALTIISQCSQYIVSDDDALPLTRFLLNQTQNHCDPAICERLGETVCSMVDAGIECNASSVFESLATAKHLKLDGDRLVHVLAGLLGLVNTLKKPTKNTSSTLKYITNFIENKLLKFDTNTIEDDEGEPIPGACDLPSIARAASFGLRLLAGIFLNTVNSADGVILKDIRHLMDICFATITSEGSTLGQMNFNKRDELTTNKVAAVCTILRLLKLKSVSTGMTIEEWQELAWGLMDNDKRARSRMLRELTTLIQTTSVHHRFMAYPVLYASDDQLSGVAERAMLSSLKRMRLTHESIVAKAMSTDNEDLRFMAECLMPENILPYTLHLLSHHPEFPTTTTCDADGDKVRLRTLIKSVKMILSVLLGSLRKGADNLSFLLKQIDTISQNYEDALDSDNLGLAFVTRIARKLLKSRIKTAENVQPYPGDILLPENLFSPRDMSDDVERMGMEFVAADGLENDADETIDRALQGFARGSPNRRTGIRSPTAKKRNRKSKTATDHEESDGDDLPDVPLLPRAQKTRSGRNITAVSYLDRGESEKEANKWDEAAGVEKEQAKKRQRSISSFFAPKASTKSSDSTSSPSGENDTTDSSGSSSERPSLGSRIDKMNAVDNEDNTESETEETKRQPLQDVANKAQNSKSKSKAKSKSNPKVKGKVSTVTSKGKGKGKTNTKQTTTKAIGVKSGRKVKA